MLPVVAAEAVVEVVEAAEAVDLADWVVDLACARIEAAADSCDHQVVDQAAWA